MKITENENRHRAGGLLIVAGFGGLALSLVVFALAIVLVFATPGFIPDEIALGVLSIFGGICSLAVGEQGNLLRAGIERLADETKAEG